MHYFRHEWAPMQNYRRSVSKVNKLNPYHAKFLKYSKAPSIYGTIHYHFKNIKMKTWCWSANSIESGQTAWTCWLAWLYTGWQRLITFGVGRIRVNKYYTCLSPLWVRAEHSIYLTARILLANLIPCSRLIGDNPCWANCPMASLFSRKSILVPITNKQVNVTNKSVSQQIDFSLPKRKLLPKCVY